MKGKPLMKTLSKKITTALFALSVSSVAHAAELRSVPLLGTIPTVQGSQVRNFRCSALNVSSRTLPVSVELLDQRGRSQGVNNCTGDASSSLPMLPGHICTSVSSGQGNVTLYCEVTVNGEKTDVSALLEVWDRDTGVNRLRLPVE
jgi:hypothetical protein